MPENILTRQIVGKLRIFNTSLIWIRQIKEYMKELELAKVYQYLKKKTDKLKNLKDKNVKFKRK